jgi:hypothetical protein
MVSDTAPALSGFPERNTAVAGGAMRRIRGIVVEKEE